MTRKTRGFTLVELLIAMSLFVVLSTALIALLTQAFGFLTAGNQGSEVSDRTTDFIRPLRADLDNLLVERSLDPGVPEIRLLSDYIRWDATGNKSADLWVQRLVFVRSTQDETADPVSRLAGSKPSPSERATGKNDADAAKAGKLMAPGGAREVMYMAVPTDPKDPGVLTLYRGVRSPPGGKGSLFDAKIRNVKQLEEVADPLMTGVLHFGVRFWSPTTKRWDSDFSRPSSAGPSLSWDSTRGVLPPGVLPNEFYFALGKDSLTDPRDDISPRMVRVLFVFERTGRQTESARLLSAIDSGARRAEVTNTAFASTSKEHRYIKIGTEWTEYSNFGPEGFRLIQRGVRGTVPLSHEEGEIVRAGYTVERVIELPSFRDDFNFR
ncbi:MAG: prepilin-type N-terminal cleavage/methylation domain-containing protein [Planctomycetota bacterium]